jgi:Uma2 family endonuclease
MAEVIEGIRRFTIEEYHRMGEAGVFGPQERVELIRGVIREMSPKGKRHSDAVALANEIFVIRLAGRARVFVQDVLRKAGWHSEPEPDLIVASNPDPRAYGTERSDTLLVIEVADTSLQYDRETKAALYAEAGVPEYWILNLNENLLEIHRRPAGSGYRVTMVLKASERVAPLAFPDLEIQVGDLLP